MTPKRSNPPIPGHELLHEGGQRIHVNPETDDYYPEGDPRRYTGGCRCGAKPPGWPEVGVNVVKRWHREHKAELRGATVSTPATHLYGEPGAEIMYDDPAEVLQRWLDDWADDPPADAAPPVIEEWDVHPPRYHLPSAERLIEWIGEWVEYNGEITEAVVDGWRDAVTTPSAEAEAFLDAIAAKVACRMARNLLRTLPVTRTDDGMWLIDGEPAWKPAP